MEKISIVDSAPPWLTMVKQDAHYRWMVRRPKVIFHIEPTWKSKQTFALLGKAACWWGSVAFICSFNNDNNKIVNFTRTEANHTDHNIPLSPCLQTQLYYAGAGGSLVDIKTIDSKTIHVLKWDQRKSFLDLKFSRQFILVFLVLKTRFKTNRIYRKVTTPRNSRQRGARRKALDRR
jgi:hypothetical protein